VATSVAGELLAVAAANGFTVPSEGDQQAILLQLLRQVASGNSPPYNLQVQRGLVEGVERIAIVGHNTDMDLGTIPEDIWEGGGLYPFQSVPQSLEILSDSVADAAAGTGMRTVRVVGLDGGYQEIQEVVTLDGTTPVALTQQYFRINQLVGVTAGSGAANAGIITLQVAGGGAVQAVMDAGDGLAHQAIYTVPAGKTLNFITRESAILRQPNIETMEIHIKIRGPGGPWISRNIFGLVNAGTSALVKELPFLAVPQFSDFRATCMNVSANNTQAMVTFECFLSDN